MSVNLSPQTSHPLYFIHGWGMNHAVWQPVLDKLPNHIVATAIDIAGFGLNANQMPAQYNLASISQMVSEQITQPGLVIGWSLGGLIAQQLALTSPQKLTGLITVGSTPKFCESDNWPGVKEQVLVDFQQQLANDYKQLLARFLAIQTIGSPTAKQDLKSLQQLLLTLPEPNQTALKSGLTILAQTDLRAQLNQIKTPTLRMYGRLDSLTPASVIKPIAALQPEAQTHIFAKASHAPFLSHCDEFIETLLQFCQTLD